MNEKQMGLVFPGVYNEGQGAWGQNAFGASLANPLHC